MKIRSNPLFPQTQPSLSQALGVLWRELATEADRLDAATATLTNKTIDIASNTLTGVAPLASPTFTDIPAGPTAAAGTNTPQLATTAFATTADALRLPLTGGTLSGPINVSGGGIGIGSGGGLSAVHLGHKSLQILSDIYYGGILKNYSGYLIYSTMPSGWGTAQLHFACSTEWGVYDTTTPALTISKTTVSVAGNLTVTGTANSIPSEAVIAPTLLNSWVNYGGTYATAGYWKDAEGIVHLHGLVKSGTIGAAIFTLPAGYRPAADQQTAVVSNGVYGYCAVRSSGNVEASSGANTTFSLNGITFRAA